MIESKKLLNSVLAVTALAYGAAAHAACPAGTEKVGNVDGKLACALKGRYTQDLVLSSNNVYVLQGGVFIGNDNKNNSTLTIQAGTKVMGESGRDFLVITRGSKINANGTKQKPIVMTTAKQSGRTRGSWGGLIINGNAPINSCPEGAGICEAEGEGGTGVYGGNQANDNSGVLRYVVVEFAGYEITPENELNGIAFQGVGSGTKVEYIQVHMNADDGVEFFGGTVNVKYVYLTGNKDDSLDWTSGWKGKAQFVVIKQYDDQGNNGIEADNLGKNHGATPRSQPTISNVTLVGQSGAALKGGDGMLLRAGTGAKIYNSIVTGFKKACISVQDAGDLDGIDFQNNIINCGVNFSSSFDLEGDFLARKGNRMANPMLKDLVPSEKSPALDPVEMPGEIFDDLFFEEVNFVGAIKSSDKDWTKGWTTEAKN
ncbi:hypothetical protein GW915_01420 [bacterium]|nr:hypothetical protein [bacterium]